MAPLQLRHSTLNGTLTPVVISQDPGIYQYRNVKYATFPKRFTYSERLDNWHGGEIGGAQFGPQCPQNYVDWSSLLRLPKSQSPDWNDPQSEFDCLHLDITVPVGTKPDAKLPVVFWITGGALVSSFGAGQSGISDPTKIVATSIRNGTPVIFVSVTFRLGLFGVLHINNDLTNFTIHDQRTALEWVQRHIAGFGGNPRNVTAIGESAGAVAVASHMLGSTPNLFRSAIMMSGHQFLAPPMPFAASEYLRGLVLDHLGITGDDWLEQLRATPTEKLVEAQKAVAPLPLAVNAEGNFWNSQPLNMVEIPSWVDRFIIGDVPNEMTLLLRKFYHAFKTTSEILELFPKIPASERVIKEYGVDHPDPKASADRVARFLTDVIFHAPADMIYKMTTAAKGEGNVFRYYFDANNPWDADVGGQHAVCVTHLFGHFQMNADSEALGEEMRERWVKFFIGEAPWDPKKVWSVRAVGDGKINIEVEDNATAWARRHVAAHYDFVKSLDPLDIGQIVPALVQGKADFDSGK